MRDADGDVAFTLHGPGATSFAAASHIWTATAASQHGALTVAVRAAATCAPLTSRQVDLAGQACVCAVQVGRACCCIAADWAAGRDRAAGARRGALCAAAPLEAAVQSDSRAGAGDMRRSAQGDAHVARAETHCWQELEPDAAECKWPLLALVYLWYALDPVAYYDDIFAAIETCVRPLPRLALTASAGWRASTRCAAASMPSCGPRARRRCAAGADAPQLHGRDEDMRDRDRLF